MIEQLSDEEAARQERHKKRIEQMQRSKRRQMLCRKFGPPAAGVILVLFLLLWAAGTFRRPVESNKNDAGQQADGKTVEIKEEFFSEKAAGAFLKAKALPETSAALEALEELCSHKTYYGEHPKIAGYTCIREGIFQ